LSTHNLKDSTVAIHGGRTLDSHASSILFPLYQTSTFVHDAVGVDKGFSYSRVSNPTVDALEKAIGALEETPPAICFRTGMAAIATLMLSVLKSGDHAVLSDVVYGGTMRLFREIFDNLGITASFVDTSDAANVEAAITSATRIVLIESPGKVRPAWAHSYGCKSRHKQVTANEAKRNCMRATECGEEAWSEAAGR
jgi:cystathionine beta-lyase/cystathionine gamma-synthase